MGLSQVALLIMHLMSNQDVVRVDPVSFCHDIHSIFFKLQFYGSCFTGVFM